MSFQWRADRQPKFSLKPVFWKGEQRFALHGGWLDVNKDPAPQASETAIGLERHKNGKRVTNFH
jgi:hypothetical protein